MDEEKMSQLHILSSELHNQLSSFIESKKAEAYLDQSFEGTVKQFFWRYIRSSLNYIANNPNFITYLQHAFLGSNDLECSDEVKKVLQELLLPAPVTLNSGVADGKSYWNYNEKWDESDDKINWMP